MRTLKNTLLVVLSATLIVACATVDPEAAFQSTAGSIAERTGVTPTWPEADPQLRDSVRARLEDGLSRQDAVEIALLMNPGIRARYREIGIAEADLVEAGRPSNPTLELETLDVPGEDPLEASLSFHLIDLLFLGERKDAAKAEMEIREAEVVRASVALSAEASKAWIALVDAHQRAELYRQVRTANRASAEFIDALREAGNVTGMVQTRERILAERAETDVIAAELEARSAWRHLNALLGLTGSGLRWRIEGRLPSPEEADLPNRDALHAEAREASLELAAARARTERAAARAGIADASAWLDDVELGVLGELEHGDWSVGPMLEFPLPVFQQGQPRRTRARLELERSLEGLLATEAALAVSVADVHDSAEEALRSVRLHEERLLPLSEELVSQARAQTNAMQMGLDGLLDVREQRIATGLSYLDALATYHRLMTDMEQLRAGRIPEGSGGLPMGGTPMGGAAKGGH